MGTNQLHSTNIVSHNNNDDILQKRQQNENITFKTPTTEEPLFVLRNIKFGLFSLILSPILPVTLRSEQMTLKRLPDLYHIKFAK